MQVQVNIESSHGSVMEKERFSSREALRVLRAKMLHEETGFLFCGG